MLIRMLTATVTVWTTLFFPALQQVGNVTKGTVAVNVELAQRKKFIFKIETKSGGIIGNILIEGKDLFDCIRKLKQRYPGCTVLEAREK